MDDWLWRFVEESNRIEGIDKTTSMQVEAHLELLSRSRVLVSDLEDFVSAVQPDAILRRRTGLNVRVGSHIAPPGGPGIEPKLSSILGRFSADPYGAHVAYENLHPFTDGNGRSGRALWLWGMQGTDKFGAAQVLGFLHMFYYQTLEASDRAA